MNRKCVTCKNDRRKKCDKQSVKDYRSFKRQYNERLQIRFWCEEVKGCCKQDKCAKYKQCRKSAKKKYEEWKKSYFKNCKSDLERLSKGGI